RCKYCHQSSLLWAGDESERSTTSTGPAGKLGGLSNSNLPSGVKVPRTTTCSVAMTVPFMLPTLNPLPFVDGVFHFCTFCTEPVKTGIRVLQGFQVGFQHQPGRFDDAASLDGRFGRTGRITAIQCELGSRRLEHFFEVRQCGVEMVTTVKPYAPTPASPLSGF